MTARAICFASTASARIFVNRLPASGRRLQASPSKIAASVRQEGRCACCRTRPCRVEQMRANGAPLWSPLIGLRSFERARRLGATTASLGNVCWQDRGQCHLERAARSLQPEACSPKPILAGSRRACARSAIRSLSAQARNEAAGAARSEGRSRRPLRIPWRLQPCQVVGRPPRSRPAIATPRGGAPGPAVRHAPAVCAALPWAAHGGDGPAGASRSWCKQLHDNHDAPRENGA